jgi:hypothetical protein
MTVCSRRYVLALAAGGLILGAGCGDLGSLAYFLMPEQRLEAKMKHLATEEKDKDPKVVILTWGGMETRSEFIHADAQLSELLGMQLRKFAEESKEKLTVIPVRKVEEFKNAHPNWRGMELAEIGRRFGVDHVIYLEINSLSLYEPGSANTLLRGRINLNVNLADVHKPDDPPAQDAFSCIYPGDAPGPQEAGDNSSKMQFRQAFLGHVARQLSYYFSRYPRNERHRMGMD